MNRTRIFGIDVGTSTTVIQQWDDAQKEAVPFKIGGDWLIPSLFIEADGEFMLGKRAAEYVSREPQKSDMLAAGFKLDFWVRTGKSADEVSLSRVRLKKFLSEIGSTLFNEFRDSFNRATFCFSYPSDQDEHLGDFAKIVAEAGFPSRSTKFVGEATAAALGFCNLKRAKGESMQKNIDQLFCNNSKSGDACGNANNKLCFVDIGAGTTDVVLVECVDNKVTLLRSGSVATAGQACTRALRTLSVSRGQNPADDPEEAWIRYASESPLLADSIKEKDFSDHYRPQGEREIYHDVTLARQGIILACNNFNSFMEAMASPWNEISSAINKTILEEDVAGVNRFLFLGGGALNLAIREHSKQEFPLATHFPDNPQIIVASGAMIHCLSEKEWKEVVKLRLPIRENVKLRFPNACSQKDVTLFRSGADVDLSCREVEKRHRVVLKSNVYRAEGKCELTVGRNEKLATTETDDVDICWKRFGERNNHPGVVISRLNTLTGQLSVQLKLDNVSLHKEVVGKVELDLPTIRRE